MTTPEKSVQNDLLLSFGARPYLRLWRANVGKAIPLGSKRVVSFGFPGQADLSGLLACGRRLEVEAKSDVGRVSPAQSRFGAMIVRFGGYYVLARSVDDLEKFLSVHLEDCYDCRAARDDPSRTAPPKQEIPT